MGFKANIRTKDGNLTTILTDDDSIQVSIYHDTFTLKAEDGMAKHHSEKLVTVFANDFDDELTVSVNDRTERPRVDEIKVMWDYDNSNYGSCLASEGGADDTQCPRDHDTCYYVKAWATVSYKSSEDSRSLDFFESSGLFSICPPTVSNAMERRKLEVEQLNELHEKLTHFNIDMESYGKALKGWRSYIHGEETTD